jgi:hypothetical protein
MLPMHMIHLMSGKFDFYHRVVFKVMVGLLIVILETGLFQKVDRY